MIKAIIQSPIIGTGIQGDSFRPQFADNYNIQWFDNGNGTITIIVDQTTFDAISANSVYTVVSFDNMEIKE